MAAAMDAEGGCSADDVGDASADVDSQLSIIWDCSATAQASNKANSKAKQPEYQKQEQQAENEVTTPISLQRALSMLCRQRSPSTRRWLRQRRAPRDHSRTDRRWSLLRSQ